MAGGDYGGGDGRDKAFALEREEKEKKKMTCVAIMELSNMISVPMSLNAVVRLKVPDAIYQSGLNAPLTAAEILSRLVPVPPSPADPCNLQRMLRMLTSYGVFREHRLCELGERRYSLTDVGMALVAPDGGGESYAPYVLQHHQEALVRVWPLLHETVLDPTVEPFSRANGGVSKRSAYQCKDLQANMLMQRAMAGVSEPFMAALLDHEAEHGMLFSRVRTLVDVGGSSGTCLNMIMRRMPQIEIGINFDVTEVVAKAPQYPDVTHVGGDMLESVPPGDAIFIKWVLTAWTDAECSVILKNCHDALPEGGKLIICEPLLPEKTDNSSRTRTLLECDVFIMAMYSGCGKERTEEEFRRLGSAAGFHAFRAIYLDPFFTVMLFQKS